MVEMSLKYLGDKACELSHGPSKVKIITDAPLDNFGKGSSFSPTDLMTSSLTACMTTIMAIQLEKEGIDLSGSEAKVRKIMTTVPPRKIAKIEIDFFPGPKVPREIESRLIEIANNCPVKLSLSQDLKMELSIVWSV